MPPFRYCSGHGFYFLCGPMLLMVYGAVYGACTITRLCLASPLLFHFPTRNWPSFLVRHDLLDGAVCAQVFVCMSVLVRARVCVMYFYFSCHLLILLGFRCSFVGFCCL